MLDELAGSSRQSFRRATEVVAAFCFVLRDSGKASMNEVTRILSDLAQGDAHAAGQLLPLVYDELRRLAAARMAAEPSGNTLNRPPSSTRRTCGWSGRPTAPAGTTAATSSPPPPRPCAASWWTPPAGSAAASTAAIGARSISTRTWPADPEAAAKTCSPWMRPSTRLAAEDPRQGRAGQAPLLRRADHRGAAAALGLSRATADRHWTYARAWLRRAVDGTSRTKNSAEFVGQVSAGFSH